MWGTFFPGEDYGLGPTSSTNVYISLVHRVTQRIDWECSFIVIGVDCRPSDTTTYVKSMWLFHMVENYLVFSAELEFFAT